MYHIWDALLKLFVMNTEKDSIIEILLILRYSGLKILESHKKKAPSPVEVEFKIPVDRWVESTKSSREGEEHKLWGPSAWVQVELS